ncbi:MAG: YhjD/YihY/BrkB family envelope integrity protein [Aliidongia sp.]
MLRSTAPLPRRAGCVDWGRFIYHVLRRYNDDGCLAAAGALSYTTLVSLVPLLAITLAVFSAFPIFDKLRGEALGFVFDAFVPRIGGTVEWYISYFASSAGKTTRSASSCWR